MKTAITFAFTMFSIALLGQWYSADSLYSSDIHLREQFGTAVKIHGSKAVVSALGNAFNESQQDSMYQSGAVFAYELINDQWVLKQKIVAPERNPFDHFGYALALDDSTLIIGAPREDEDEFEDNYLANAGSAYAYKWNQDGWILKQKITAAFRQAHASFGESMDIQGEYLVIGAPNYDLTVQGNTMNGAGAVHVFKNIDGRWHEKNRLHHEYTTTSTIFGISLKLDQENLFVGAINGYDPAGPGANDKAGSVSVFKRNNNSWEIQQTLYAPEKKENQGFGHSSIAAHGNMLVIGAYTEEIDGLQSGAAYSFDFVNGSWQFSSKLQSPQPNSPGNFGYCIALTEDTLVISAPFEGDSVAGKPDMASSGNIYFFKREQNNWKLTQSLTQGDRDYFNLFGMSMALSGPYLMVGAPFDSHDNPNLFDSYHYGSVSIFKNSSITGIAQKPYRNSFKLFHNPAEANRSNRVNLEELPNQKALSYRIYNLGGMILENGRTTGNTFKIDAYPPGIYTVIFNLENGQEIPRKLILR